jgi:hypothetical protein
VGLIEERITPRFHVAKVNSPAWSSDWNETGGLRKPQLPPEKAKKKRLKPNKPKKLGRKTKSADQPCHPTLGKQARRALNELTVTFFRCLT